MEKVTIKNRKNQNIVLILEKAQDQKGLAFVMHGLGGFKEQPHIETFAKAFSDASYTVVRFDTTNTYGESDGDYADATTTNYYEDLEDVISWAKTQPWYQEPFCLSGHSLGGISTALYAEKYPEKLKALAPISTVVSGELSLKTFPKEELENWKKTGWRERESETTPGQIKRLKWTHIEDRMKYDLLPQVEKLTMPVLLIVGEKDEHLFESQTLFAAISGSKKELHLIKGAPHTFRTPEHLAEIKNILDKWVEKIG